MCSSSSRSRPGGLSTSPAARIRTAAGSPSRRATSRCSSRTSSRFRFLIHDRDTKFSHAFDEVFRTEGIKIIRTPVQAPNANAFAERWVRIIRADCLDRILTLGRRHLEHMLRVYRRHYNEHRPHRALELLPPDGGDPAPLNIAPCLHRRDLLGGLIHGYEA